MEEQNLSQFITNMYGIVVQRIQKFSHGVMNDNYCIFSENGEKYTCKIYRCKTIHEIQYEIHLLEYLANQLSFVPHVCKTIQHQSSSIYQDKPCVLFTYIDGTMLTNPDDAILFQTGMFLGRFHKVTNSYTPIFVKSTWDHDSLYTMVFERGEELCKRKFPDAEHILSFVQRELKKYIFPFDLPQGMTHQDVKCENIIVKDNNVVGIIDFDNCYYGTLLHDITTSIIWMCVVDNNISLKKIQTFLQGYEKERMLSSVEKKYFVDALKWRLLREIFIGPFVTFGHDMLIYKRSLFFKDIYANYLKINSIV